MITRLVEDWLTRVNERQLELPFGYLLLSKGHKVVHLTRHGEMEQGKDVISIGPDSTPCAFQLKAATTGRIRQADWDDMLPQIGRLVELPIKHPAVPSGTPHRAYLVTNGNLDEPVRIEIEDRNKDWLARYGRSLEVIVKGEILRDLLQLQTDFWPTQPADVRTLLEHFLAQGNASIKRGSFFSLLENELAQVIGRPQTVIGRAIASTGILCSYAITPYISATNHMAIAEAWLLFIAAVMYFAEREDLDPSLWQLAVALAEDEAFGALQSLWEELKNRRNLFEGNVLVDAVEEPFYRARTTLVLGLISAWALMRLGRNMPLDEAVISKLEEFEGGLWLWGESAVSHFLAWFWFKGRKRGGIAVEAILLRLIRSIVDGNGRKSSPGLPDPYHSSEEVISTQIIGKKIYEESFRFRSYTLQPLIQLATSRLWRQHLASLWPGITRISFDEFQPSSLAGFYRWRCEDGNHLTRIPRQPESWRRLQTESEIIEEERIPIYLRMRPWLLLLFVLVYPHRLTLDVAKYLDRWACHLDAQELHLRSK